VALLLAVATVLRFRFRRPREDGTPPEAP